MADWLNISSGSDSEDDGNNHEIVFKYAVPSYLTEFDDGYDPNADPDFEVPDDYEVGAENDFPSHDLYIAEEFEDDDDAFDTQVCFKGKTSPLLLGPCDHMCCKVWCLEPIGFINPEIVPPLGGVEQFSQTPMCSFLTHHGKSSGNGCTDKECKNPNATGILIKASLKTSLFERASNIFNSKTTKKFKSKANSSKISFRKPTA